MDHGSQFSINGVEHNCIVSSKNFKQGKDICLFTDPIFTNKEMLTKGYTIRKFPDKWLNSIRRSVTKYLLNEIDKHSTNHGIFTLEKYHECVDDELHKKVVNGFRGGAFGLGGIHLSKLGIPYQELDTYINKSIGSTGLSCHYRRYGLSLKHFWIRIVRPNVRENNPPHKDIHVKWNRDSINIYLPLAGSNKLSSLPVIPKSHLEMESETIVSSSPSYVDGRKFVVPAIVYRKKGLHMITPNPVEKEIMIFTPHLIHGGGVNHNKDLTRVSLEMRFFK